MLLNGRMAIEGFSGSASAGSGASVYLIR